jgi:serine phosphatase RsbU (regulator of sigma subunit)
VDTSLVTAASPHPWTGPPAEPGQMQVAERVQAQLRPREHPHVETLEFAGGCLPGRAVGGDFYDFLQPTPGRLALILGDVSGHGVPAALMMAALQASLRTHYALSSADLGQRIRSVNRLFFDCTAAEHYAGLFVGEYDEPSGRLRYANCGHVSPVLVRADGGVERLEPTGTVLGMFDSWGGSLDEVTLAAGDTLVLVTDGIVEATDPGQGEFGELRLLSSIMRYRHLGPAALIRAIARDVRLACGRRPLDDATVVVARVRERTRA